MANSTQKATEQTIMVDPNHKDTITKIWNWFGDYGPVFFCKEDGNIFSSTPEQMLKCFNVLLLKEGSIYISLKSEEFCKNNGIVDSMESLACHETYNMEEDTVIQLDMEYEEGGKLIDCIEMNREVKIKELFDQENKPTILHGQDYVKKFI